MYPEKNSHEYNLKEYQTHKSHKKTNEKQQ